MADQDEQERVAGPADEERGGTSLGLVGIGVCAASLPTLVGLFADLTPDTDAAYLIAVRQREGLTVAAVLDALGQSPLPVGLAADGERVVAGRVYVCAPDDLLTLEDGHLRTRTATEPTGHRGTFDSLLISLAEVANERAVAVMLRGLGSDGAAGIVATKTFGGLSIAEVEEHAGDFAAPGSADPAAVADLHLPGDRIAAEIVRYLRNLRPILKEEARDEESGEVEAQVTQVATILRNVTSHDFHGYKRGTFIRRIRRRIQVLQIDGGLDAYVERLRTDREEVQHLFQDLLIGVTQFFRDPAEFDILERELPRLFEHKSADDQFRVWVLGCATGEEAFSIAILLREHMATLDHPPEVQIFATDLDARALSLARAGRYSDAIANHVRPDRLERWFVREGDTWCVSKELREMCIFSPHNIVKDAPFSRIDVLSCRNLLIYLSTDLQNRVIPIFHFSLRPGGVLFLGSSENVTRHQKLFAPVDRKSRVFRRLETATRIIPDFPLTPRARGEQVIVELPSAQYGGRLPAAVSRQADAVAERYAPAYVVVDTHGDVLHFSGRTGRYLEPTAGAATLNLPNLVHRDLRLDLRSALGRAIAENRRVEMPHLAFRQDDRTSGVNLIVEPLGTGDVTSLVVVLQDIGAVADVGVDGDRLSSDEHVQRLEAELRVTRNRLQATIEELESTNEELKSSNEEYQSINEELQSANEEMETSKEELQSVNEELHTVNGELAHRVGELGHTNSDLKNLLESTQIATVFLDNDLRVRNFTPAATDIFHLLDTDVGRPLDHVVSRVEYPELQEDVRRVLKTLVPVDRQVLDPTSGRQFAARVLPYRSIDNYISGAVVTFADFTALYRAQDALRDSQERQAFLLRLSDALRSSAGTQRVIEDASRLLGERLGASRVMFAEIDEVGGLAHIRSAWTAGGTGDHPATLRLDDVGGPLLDDLRAGRTVRYDDVGEPPYDRPDLAALAAIGVRAGISVPLLLDGRFVFNLNVHQDQPRRWTDAEVELATEVADRLWAAIERARAEAALHEAEQRQQVLIEGVPQLVWRADVAGAWTWASPQWTDYTGQAEADSHGDGWLSQIDPDDREATRAAWAEAAERGGVDLEHRIRTGADGSYRWFRTRATAVRDDEDAIVEWLGTSTDVDDMRALQKRQEVLVAELQHRVRNMLTVVRSVFSQTVAGGGDLAEAAGHFRGRLDALARTQVIVTRTAAGKVDLEDLIRDELLSVGRSDGETLTLAGPDVALPSRTAESIGLAIHELTTNALKYGALKVAGARLDVTWSVRADGDAARRLVLVWAEQGVPAVPTRPAREGFGRELIEEALPYRLGAETRLEFLGGGVRCTISVPLPHDEDDARGDRP